MTKPIDNRIISNNSLYVLRRPDVKKDTRIPAAIPPMVSMENDFPGI